MMSTPIGTGCILQKYSKYVHTHQSRIVTIETKRSPIEWKTNHWSEFPHKYLSYTNHTLVGSQIHLVVYLNTFSNKQALSVERRGGASLH